LSILVFFLLLQLLAPLVSPYHPAKDLELASPMAVPDWLKFFDQRVAHLPPTMNFDMLSYAKSNLTSIRVSNSSLLTVRVVGDEIVIVFRDEQGAFKGKANVTFLTPFQYEYDKPDAFSVMIKGNVTDYEARGQFMTAEFKVQKPSGEVFRVWKSEWTQEFMKCMQIGTTYRLRSSDQLLMLSLGVVPQREIIAWYAFNETGQLNLITTFIFHDYGNEPSKLEFRLSSLELKIFGRRFGILGTDDQGRDCFKQLASSAWVSIGVGVLASGLSVMLSVIIGVTAACMGGKVDEILMRVADVLMVIPGLPLMIAVLMVIKGTIWHVMVLLSLIGWGGGARKIRAFTLTIINSPYIEAARARGAGVRRIVFKHILPATLPLAYADIAMAAPGAILSEASLSYLGLGTDPFLITWGKMLNFAQTGGAIQRQAWWWLVPPGVAIGLLSLSFTMIGYALDEVFNPRLRKTRR
jgi:ABC-type dipeptide/oligopeptide/nickel transport system permease subunit